MVRTTPVRKQYLQIKSQYPEAIVFFRLGDFYETFDQDAEIASRELDIVLTSRNVAKNQRVPMAGVPHHAVEDYIARLVTRGYKVAICDQVGPLPKQGLVHRQVTRVVTPGTVVEPELLEEKENSFLAALVVGEDGQRAGVAYGAIVQYLGRTQKAALAHLNNLHTYSTAEFMTLDANTRRNLELTETIRGGGRSGSLLGVLDATVTAMGGRLLRQWINRPLLDINSLQERLDAVESPTAW